MVVYQLDLQMKMAMEFTLLETFLFNKILIFIIQQAKVVNL